MSCTLRFPDSNVAKALRKLTGSNDRLYASYLAKTVKGGELTKDFVEWYQARHPHAKEVSTDASEGVVVRLFGNVRILNLLFTVLLLIETFVREFLLELCFVDIINLLM